VFCWIGRVAFWLLQGQRDRGADELEGLPLGAGRLGEHRDGDLGAGVPDLVAGQRGQVLDQAAEAAVGRPAGSYWPEALAWAAAERRAGATGLSGAGGSWSVKVSGAQARRRCQVR
jgi:hypothetical protein